MNHQISTICFVLQQFDQNYKKKKWEAIDIACGEGSYSKILSRNCWYTNTIDLEKDTGKNIKFLNWNLEKNPEFYFKKNCN